jgi:hypothetical protein
LSNPRILAGRIYLLQKLHVLLLEAEVIGAHVCFVLYYFRKREIGVTGYLRTITPPPKNT